MQNKLLVPGIIVALIVGYVGGYFMTKSTYDQKIESAMKYFPSVTDIRSISGTVKDISGNTITIETQGFGNPFEDVPLVRTVNVTDNTTITKQENIDQAEFQKLQDAYQKEMKKVQDSMAKSGSQATPQSYPTPPVPFKTIDLSISDIKVGDNVSVMADQNIKMEKSFDAVSIAVSESVAAPAGIAPAPAGTPSVAPEPAGTTHVPPPPAPTTPPVTNIPPAPAPAP